MTKGLAIAAAATLLAVVLLWVVGLAGRVERRRDDCLKAAAETGALVVSCPGGGL